MRDSVVSSQFCSVLDRVGADAQVYVSLWYNENNKKETLYVQWELQSLINWNRVLIVTPANKHNSASFPGNHNHLWQFFTASVDEMRSQNINGLLRLNSKAPRTYEKTANLQTITFEKKQEWPFCGGYIREKWLV